MATPEKAEKRLPSTSSSGPWSSHHSLALTSKLPGTPVRQQYDLLLPVVDQSSTSTCTTSSNAEILHNRFTELDLLLEYKLLCLNCPAGVYVLPSTKSLYEWHGVLFVHSGPYKEGIFRFTMCIPDGFPRQRPMVRFHSRVFHPYIHADNGVLNMLRAFPSWDGRKHHLWHIIRYTKQCFFNSETWGEFDEETGRQRFEAQAQACALESLQNVHDPMGDEDSNLIRFKDFNESKFREAKKILQRGDLPSPSSSTSSYSMLTNVKDHMKQLWDKIVTR